MLQQRESVRGCTVVSFRIPPGAACQCFRVSGVQSVDRREAEVDQQAASLQKRQQQTAEDQDSALSREKAAVALLQKVSRRG